MGFSALFGHEVVHFLLSILAAVAAALFFLKNAPKKKSAAPYLIMLAGGLLGEFLLDADHLFDYLLVYGPHFDPYTFFSGKMFDQSGKVILPLHSWELLIVLGVAVYFIRNKNLKYFLLAVTFGLFFHLAYDQVYNHISLFGYSWFYRLYHHFDMRYINSS